MNFKSKLKPLLPYLVPVILFGLLSYKIWKFQNPRPDQKLAAAPLLTEDRLARLPHAGLSVMFMNTENLFDTVPDPEGRDISFLPRSEKTTQVRRKCQMISHFYYRKQCLRLDWNSDVLEIKMKSLASVVFQATGQSPDILALSEVENKNVLMLWNQTHLKAANYQTQVLIEGHDPRGIDQALLSRFPLISEPQLHQIPGLAPGRGILDVELMVDQTSVRFFVFHFPSQASPTHHRLAALNYLRQLIQRYPPQTAIVALGDGNITQAEEKKSALWSSFLPLGDISHLSAQLNAPGTHRYGKKWNYLDVIFVSKSLRKKWGLPRFEVVNGLKQQRNAEGAPQRFSAEVLPESEAGGAFGVSDHFPILAQLGRVSKNPKALSRMESRHLTGETLRKVGSKSSLKPKLVFFRGTTVKASRRANPKPKAKAR